MLMNRLRTLTLLFLAPALALCSSFSADSARAQASSQSGNQPGESAPPAMTDARLRTAAEPSVALPPQQLFGTLPVSTRSLEARKLLEQAIDQYENVELDNCLASARKATEKDPKFALAYAVWSFAARRDEPAPEAIAKANQLAAAAPAEERLLVHWMTATQSPDLLPAIQAMNDLLTKFPKNKHILYLTAEWLYFQQDYDRSRKLFEEALRLDPNFPPALNMLGYASLETGEPDPAKAVAALRRYAELLPNQPNPQDSLGEISRYIGDDKASLEHYAAALKISPTFYTSQIGLGDTSALMGDYSRARAELDKAIPMVPTNRDKLHIEFEKAMVSFWEGKPEQGRAELATLAAKAAAQKDAYAQSEIGLGRAFLAKNMEEELSILDGLEAAFAHSVPGMSDTDRHTALASMLRERVRLLSLKGQRAAAGKAVEELEQLATRTRDQIIEDCYDSARGYLLFAEGDYSGALEELGTDTQNPLVARQIVLTYEKLGDAGSAALARNRLKYLRAPTPQWYLVTQAANTESAAVQ